VLGPDPAGGAGPIRASGAGPALLPPYEAEAEAVRLAVRWPLAPDVESDANEPAVGLAVAPPRTVRFLRLWSTRSAIKLT
jgi:hypothetical protein